MKLYPASTKNSHKSSNSNFFHKNNNKKTPLAIIDFNKNHAPTIKNAISPVFHPDIDNTLKLTKKNKKKIKCDDTMRWSCNQGMVNNEKNKKVLPVNSERITLE